MQMFPDLRGSRILQPSLRLELLRQRYLLKDPQGEIVETPHGMLARVASAVASVEAAYGADAGQVRGIGQQFYCMMRRRMFLPNSPALMNAGRKDGMCCACFVLDLDDSIDGIFETIKQTAVIQKAGGGTGFAFDKLRPTGDLVASTGGRTSGPVSFWRVLCETTRAIQQGAHRRGANMAMIGIEHPDILKFIMAKTQPGAFENFNVSIKVTDTFMRRLHDDPQGHHVVVNPRDQSPYILPRSVSVATYTLDDLLAPEPATSVPCYTRSQIWDLIVTTAHATGEPGLCFIDRVNEDNPTPALGRIHATNPCHEEPLLAYEACNLGSLNLAAFIRPNRAELDWDKLRLTIPVAVRFLDNVVDLTYYPTEQIRMMSTGNRKIGLGVMGFADCLIGLGLRYDTPEAVQFAYKVSQFIQVEAHRASESLARQRGCFPNWTGSVWHTRDHRPMRNASVTTVAPTGSISILANCSSGIEPLFHLAYRRRVLDGLEFIEVHPLLKMLGHKDGWMTDEVRQAMLDGLPADRINGLPRELARVLVTAHEVAPEWHVRMQAAFQDNIDSAVSKTVNLKVSATAGDVAQVFRLAYAMRCKGITVYVDGSRSGQAFAVAKADAPSPETVVRPRDRLTYGQTLKFRMSCGTLFVTVNRDDRGLCEVFANLGKAGGCSAQSEATCRAASVALRAGVDPRQIVEQLRGIRCLSTAKARSNGHATDVLSCPDAIAKAIEEALGDGKQPSPSARTCPACGEKLRREAGCFVCVCGYSQCS